eukprot:7387962-Prymnesium_polylepis.2
MAAARGPLALWQSSSTEGGLVAGARGGRGRASRTHSTTSNGGTSAVGGGGGCASGSLSLRAAVGGGAAAAVPPPALRAASVERSCALAILPEPHLVRARALVVGEHPRAVLPQRARRLAHRRHARGRRVLRARRDAARLGPEHDDRLDDLAQQLVGDAVDARVQHGRVVGEHALDLDRVDVLAARQDHVLEPVAHRQVAVRLLPRHIARAEPAVRRERLRRRLRVVVVGREDSRPPDLNLALRADAGERRRGALLHQTHLDGMKRSAGRGDELQLLLGRERANRRLVEE